MGEQVEYRLTVTGLKESDIDEIHQLCSSFGDYDFSENGDELEIVFPDSRRGGGRSCEEIFGGHFKEFLEYRNYLTYEAQAVYLEHCPVETLFYKEN